MRPSFWSGTLAAAALAGGCTPSAVYVPPSWTQELERDAAFESAVLLDATHVVFAVGNGRFRYVAPDPLRDRGHREYVRDEHLLGVYDLATDTAHVLHIDRKDRLSDGNGAFALAEARGNHAFGFRERTTENGVMVGPGGWFLLDLETGALEALALEAELAARGHAPSRAPLLVDGAGTLLVIARPLAASTDGDAHRHYYLRRRGGELVDLGVGELRGDAHGWVFLGRPDRDGADAIEVATGAVRRLGDAELDVHRDALRARSPGTLRVTSQRTTLVVETEAVRTELYVGTLL